MILCQETNKYYIGKTSRKLSKRFTEHVAKAHEETSPAYTSPLSAAIRKYGKIAFKIGLIADNVPDEDIDIVEAHYIDMYNATDPSLGYNMSPGNNLPSVREDDPTLEDLEQGFNDILGEIDEA